MAYFQTAYATQAKGISECEEKSMNQVSRNPVLQYHDLFTKLLLVMMDVAVAVCLR